MSPTIEFDLDVLAFPSVTGAAAMLGIDKATVSKAGLELIESGDTKRVQPRDVLELGFKQRKRPLTEVAGSLLTHAEENAPQAVPEVRSQIDAFFAEKRGAPPKRLTRDQFLAEARRFLSDKEFAQLEQRYDEAHGQAAQRRAPVSGFVGRDA